VLRDWRERSASSAERFASEGMQSVESKYLVRDASDAVVRARNSADAFGASLADGDGRVGAYGWGHDALPEDADRDAAGSAATSSAVSALAAIAPGDMS
jgi:hypothetical protein